MVSPFTICLPVLLSWQPKLTVPLGAGRVWCFTTQYVSHVTVKTVGYIFCESEVLDYFDIEKTYKN